MRTDGHEVVAARRALSRRAARAPRAVRCRGRGLDDDGATAGAVPAVRELVLVRGDLRVLLEVGVVHRDVRADVEDLHLFAATVDRQSRQQSQPKPSAALTMSTNTELSPPVQQRL